MDVDFALHGDAGPASRWAARATPGDRVLLLGPTVKDNRSVSFRPPPGTGQVLIAADASALPAAAAILAWLPAGTAARVWIEVPSAQDEQPLPTAADAEITWLVRKQQAGGSPLLDAVRAAAPEPQGPAGPPYVWLAGEAGAVTALRRHLVGERGFDRRAVNFTGYWRAGTSEEQRRAELVAAATG